MVKNLPAMQETWVRSLGLEEPLEKEMATHSSILAWRIPWTEEPGGLQSMESQKSRTRLSDQTTATFFFYRYKKKATLTHSAITTLEIKSLLSPSVFISCFSKIMVESHGGHSGGHYELCLNFLYIFTFFAIKYLKNNFS